MRLSLLWARGYEQQSAFRSDINFVFFFFIVCTVFSFFWLLVYCCGALLGFCGTLEFLIHIFAFAGYLLIPVWYHTCAVIQ